MSTEVIAALGGNRALAKLLRVNPSVIGMWKLRKTIPWRYRPVIARIAAERAIPLPPDYWGEAA